jgi:hypothetical protein
MRTMNNIQRFSLHGIDPKPDDNGDWVRWDDVKGLIEEQPHYDCTLCEDSGWVPKYGGGHTCCWKCEKGKDEELLKEERFLNMWSKLGGEKGTVEDMLNIHEPEEE